MTTLEQIDRSRVPQHVAIIMDGNGRWAMKQQQERLFGHHNGLTAVREAVEAAVEMGVKYLTLYTFSTENWNRPQAEVDGLMELLITAIEENTAMLLENGVRLATIGDFNRIPERSRKRFQQCMDQTAGNSTLTLVIALSYSSRWEIAEALKQVCRERLNPEDVDEETLRRYLTTRDYPDPDLLIRTGGELRVSNFLLWQMAYTEFYFSEQLWPDFRHEDFYVAVLDYQRRQRRFGKTESQVENEE
ncbi:MAG: isoprenyl transferase [Bacteroidales bacterium]|jgi:undecaprenyl diphosphate synthase|nr:isoprenyl transferase [Bacteroidales bacterium]